MTFESRIASDIPNGSDTAAENPWAVAAAKAYTRTEVALIPGSPSGPLEPRPGNPIEPRPEPPKPPIEPPPKPEPPKPEPPRPPIEPPPKPEPPKPEPPRPPIEPPPKPEPPKEPKPPEEPEPPEEPKPEPPPPLKVERPHFKLPPVEMPAGNFFRPLAPKTPDAETVTPEPPAPVDRSAEPIPPVDRSTEPPPPPEQLIVPPLTPEPPTGVFTGEGSGGKKRIVTLVQPGQETSREWIEIPRLNTGKIVVEDVGTGKEGGRKLPPSVNPNDAVPPKDKGAVGEWNRQIPGKTVDLAHGPLGDRNGPFGNLEKLQQGDIVRRFDDGETREYRVTKVDRVRRDDKDAWKEVFAATPAGRPDQWVGVTCIGPTDKHGLSLDRTVAYGEAVDGRSSQELIKPVSKIELPAAEIPALVAAPAPVGKAAEVKAPTGKAADLGGTITLSNSVFSGEGTGQMGEVRISTPDGTTLGITTNPSVHIEKNIHLVNTENDKLFITPGVGYNFGNPYPTSTFASIVGKGPSLDLSATYAHRLSDQGAAAFVRGGGSYQPEGEFKTQWFAQAGLELPVGDKLKLMGGVSVQGAATDASNPRVADTSVGPFARISYDINEKTRLSLEGQEAGGNSKVTFKTTFRF